MTPEEYVAWYGKARESRKGRQSDRAVQTEVLIQILTEYTRTESGREKVATSMIQPARQWRDDPDNWIDIDFNLTNLENFFSFIPDEELLKVPFVQLRAAYDQLKEHREALNGTTHLLTKTGDQTWRRIEDYDLMLPWDP